MADDQEDQLPETQDDTAQDQDVSPDDIRPLGDEAASNMEIDGELTDDDIDKLNEVMTVKDAPDEDEFYKNLVIDMDSTLMNKLESYLRETIQQDIDANERSNQKYAEALKRTGFGDEAPGGAAFEGASRAVHPLLAEAAIDFQANTIKELLPASGPIKCKLEDNYSEERLARAYRVEKKLNKQLTEECQEYIPNMERMLSQLPLNGDQYMKCMWDFRYKRPKFEFVPSDMVIIPPTANDFYTSDRYTHRQDMTDIEYRTRIDSELYYDPDEDFTRANTDESTEADRANQRIIGITKDSEDMDELNAERTLYETHIMLDWAQFGEEGFDPEAKHDYTPYIITRLSDSDKIVAIYRNWLPDDENQEKMDWMVQFPFIPWRGPKAIGLVQLIGSLSAAATGSLRALLDAAMIQNMPALLKLKSRQGGQNINVAATGITEIEGTSNVDDIRKTIMPMPFNGPSSTLYELLGFIVNEARGVVRTSMDDVGEDNSNVPVGTTLARIEQGMKVFSSIYMRLHRSQAKLISILCRLNSQYLETIKDPDQDDDDVVTAADFDGINDIVPVSDPNIYSDMQRIYQSQGVMQLATQFPQLYDLRAINRKMLMDMRVPNIDELMPKPQDQRDENPVTENVKLGMGQGAFALPDQDHMAHLKVHIDWFRNPLFGKNPMFQQAIPQLYEHVKQHILLLYADITEKIASKELGKPVATLVKGKLGENTEVMKELSRLLATASNEVNPILFKALTQIQPDIQQMSQLTQQMKPPQPVDPGQAMLQAKQMDVQAKQQDTQADMQQKQAQTQQQAQESAAQNALDQQKLQVQHQDDVLKLQTDLQTNEEDNQTATTIATMQLASGHGTALKDGNGIGE